MNNNINIEHYLPYQDDQNVYTFIKQRDKQVIAEMFSDQKVNTRINNLLKSNKYTKNELKTRVKSYYINIMKKKFNYSELLTEKYLQFFMKYKEKERDLIIYSYDVPHSELSKQQFYIEAVLAKSNNIRIKHLYLDERYTFKYDSCFTRWESTTIREECKWSWFLNDDKIFEQFILQSIQIGAEIQMTTKPINFAHYPLYPKIADILSTKVTISYIDLDKKEITCICKNRYFNRLFLQKISNRNSSTIEAIHFKFKIHQRNIYMVLTAFLQIKEDKIIKISNLVDFEYDDNAYFIDKIELINHYIDRDQFDKYIIIQKTKETVLNLFYGTELFSIMGSYLSG